MECSYIFRGGVFLLTAPFVVYFAGKGLFRDFIFGTIGYNTLYTSHMAAWWREDFSLTMIPKFFLDFFPAFSGLFAGMLAIRRRAVPLGSFYLFTSLLQIALFMNGSYYRNYALICVPQFILLLHEADMCRPALLKYAGFLWLGWYALHWGGFFALNIVPDHYERSRSLDQGLEALMAEVPREDTFIAYNGDHGIYLWFDRKPCYRFFILQDWHAGFSEALGDDIRETFASCEATWILVNGEQTAISDILECSYEVWKSDYVGEERYRLYHICNTKSMETERDKRGK